MVTLEIDTERGNDDILQQIMELETSELLELYKMFEDNPTVFQYLSDELDYRKNGAAIRATKEQEAEIERLLGV